MTDQERKAMEMALKALEHVDRFDLNRRFCFDEEIDALHAALAQPEQDQEPEIVRSVRTYTGKRRRDVSNPCISANECIELANWIDSKLNAPPSKPWVSLTDEEIAACGWCDLKFARAIEAKLKEKNT